MDPNPKPPPKQHSSKKPSTVDIFDSSISSESEPFPPSSHQDTTASVPREFQTEPETIIVDSDDDEDNDILLAESTTAEQPSSLPSSGDEQHFDPFPMPQETDQDEEAGAHPLGVGTGPDV